MAIYYAKRSCGCEEKVILYGKHKDREKTLERMQDYPCPKCRAEEGHKAADASGLPRLKGSDKQVSWAYDIRSEALGLPWVTPEIISKKTNASWWIENRHYM